MVEKGFSKSGSALTWIHRAPPKFFRPGVRLFFVSTKGCCFTCESIRNHTMLLPSAAPENWMGNAQFLGKKSSFRLTIALSLAHRKGDFYFSKNWSGMQGGWIYGEKGLFVKDGRWLRSSDWSRRCTVLIFEAHE